MQLHKTLLGRPTLRSWTPDDWPCVFVLRARPNEKTEGQFLRSLATGGQQPGMADADGASCTSRAHSCSLQHSLAHTTGRSEGKGACRPGPATRWGSQMDISRAAEADFVIARWARCHCWAAADLMRESAHLPTSTAPMRLSPPPTARLQSKATP